MKTYNYIYLITNKINGKIYIGKHSTNDLNDNYFGSGVLIKKSIQKYGIENFTKDYLAFCDTEEKLNYLERYYIRKYKANINGYNLTNGGDGGKTSGSFQLGHKDSVETRMKKSQSQTGKSYVRTEEFKEKQRQSHLGKKHSKEQNNKHSEFMKQYWETKKQKQTYKN